MGETRESSSSVVSGAPCPVYEEAACWSGEVLAFAGISGCAVCDHAPPSGAVAKTSAQLNTHTRTFFSAVDNGSILSSTSCRSERSAEGSLLAGCEATPSFGFLDSNYEPFQKRLTYPATSRTATGTCDSADASSERLP